MCTPRGRSANRSTGLTEQKMTQPSQSKKLPSWCNRQFAVTVTLLSAVFLWAYFPTLRELVDVWEREPDYSHGYLVIPLFIFFLYLRRESLPKRIKGSWWGLLLLTASIGLRFAGGRYFLTPLDGWSIMLWVAGATMCLGGWPLLKWSLPPTLFLLFMVPLPYRFETLISEPLQMVAAALSSFFLQCLGQPAFAEETTILIGGRVLEVEKSCSGLRIFVGIFALASAYLIAFRREVWEATLLILSVIPVALLANAARIVVTAILFQHFSDEAAQHFSHDVAGWLMIPLAAALLGAVQWYLNCLMRDAQASDVGELVQEQTSTA